MKAYERTSNVRVVALAPNYVNTGLVAPFLKNTETKDRIGMQGGGAGMHEPAAVGKALAAFLDEPEKYGGGSVATMTNNGGVFSLNLLPYSYFRDDEEAYQFTGFHEAALTTLREQELSGGGSDAVGEVKATAGMLGAIASGAVVGWNTPVERGAQ